MTSEIWKAWGDPQLIHAVWSLLVADESVCPLESFEDPMRLRAVLRNHGIAMKVRAITEHSLRSSTRTDTPTLFIHRGRVVFTTRRSNRWHSHSIHGGLKLTTEGLLEALGLASQMHEPRDRDELWREIDLDTPTREALENKLSPASVARVAEILRVSSDFIDSPELMTSLALEYPDDFPSNLEGRQFLSDVSYEIRFIKQLRLDSGRSPIWTIFDLLRRESRFIILFLLTGLAATPLGFAAMVITATLVDYARGSTVFPGYVFGFGLLVILATYAIGLLQGYGLIRLAERLRVRLTNAYVFRIHGANASSVRNLADGDLVTRLSDLFTIQSLVFDKLLPLITAGYVLIGGLLYILRLADYVLPVVIGGIALSAAAILYPLGELKRIRYLQLKNSSRLRDRLLERVEGWKVFRHFDLCGCLFRRVDSSLVKVAQYTQRQTVISSWISFLAGLASAAALSVTLWLLSTNLQSGQASIGQLTVTIGILAATYAQLLGLINTTPSIVLAEPSLRRLNELIDCTEPESFVIADETIPSGIFSLSVRGLDYSYSEHNLALQNFDLDVAPGEWVAVIGPSGSGKSTLASILGGIIDPQQGQILIDNSDAAQLRREYRRRLISVVTQEAFLFDRSIRDNIILGNVHASEEDIERAVQKSGLQPLIAQQPLGLNQPVGDNGAFLSVGEKCRISIARSLLHKPGLLILDEALARQDTETAQSIRQELRRIDCSVIVMTHDLIQAQDCDRIYVIDEGKNAESGTPSSLKRAGGLFSDMFRSGRGPR